MGDECGELFIEGGGYFSGLGEVSVVECDGLVWGLGGLLPVEGTEDIPEVFSVVFV